ncbi:TonB-linked outer membrane protein, SusC/RagA family [Parapedobacter indicus]|uniref:TonB-linked outer membrane protein, SusC/RagA family n=2 Tax=Parapedobacter indicus TaxID=1477437 RepID=A0A1I3TSZ1_9SPHI|nr:TonB-linked SusC/RagA family outer membrane protein [Parapedobacter indicus]SFJ72657.1 TonB-linked outer membrane protein, SusC/RagA family [Parapedobacter indicus]
MYEKKVVLGIPQSTLYQLCIPVIMRLTVILFVLSMHASVWASAQKITLQLRSVPLETVFQELTRQTGYYFLFDADAVTRSPKVDVTCKNATIQEVLNQCIGGLPLTYTIEEKSVVISRASRSKMPTVQPQQRVISGRITTANGEPLEGVTISWKQSQRSVISDRTGRYQVTVPIGETTLVFTMVGYTRAERSIGQASTVDVVLQQAIDDLEEVVVIGYGTVRKSDLTGAVATISEQDVKATPVVDFGRALQGRAPGVLVTQNAGNPGSPATIRIRGTGSVNAGNDPLYVVDGFPTSSINTLNPADIESIEILKDASSTAIYGSRGSNGVVIVTTKRGKVDQNEIAFESYYGIQRVRHTIPLLNSLQYAEFINDARVNGGGTAYFDGSSPERPRPEQIDINTDWQEQVLRTAPLQQYQLMLTGGESKTRYAISGNIYSQEGIIDRSSFKRYTLRTNIDRELSKYVAIGLNLTGSMTNGQAAHSQIGGGSNAGVMNAAINYAPVFSVFNEDGSYYRDQGPLNGNLVDNPVGIAREITDKTLGNRIFANAFADVKLWEGLTLRTSLGGNLENVKNNYYVTRNIGLGMGTNGVARVSANMGREWLNENTLTFDRAFGQQHHLTALAGYTVQGTYVEGVIANAADFIDDFALYHNLGAGGTLQRPYSDSGDWALQSYLARINYRFQDRFLLTLTARADGSSRFGPNKKYGFFPSGAFAWRVINESFMRNQQTISDFKLRVSYGLTGNQDIRDFGYLSIIGYVQYPLGGANPVLQTGAKPLTLGNLDLGWESNAQLDAGIDLALWSNRVRITADYYRKRTFNLLFDVNVPQTSGYSISLRNIGEVENRGFELALNTINVKREAFEWTTAINLTTNRNKVLSLDGREEFTTGAGSGHHGVSNTILMKVGEPLGNFYGRKVVGIFQSDAEASASGQANAQAGDLRYADINNDGEINDNDRTVIGNGNPPFFGGISNEFRWRNVDLSLFLQGSLGNDILNFARFDLYSLNGNNNQSIDVLDRWTPTNPSQTIPRANSTGGQRILSSFHIEDGSYLRLKNISLGYTFKGISVKGMGIREVRIYAAAQNYLTFTNYKGFDPEVSRFGSSAINQGMDFDGYPNAKTLLFGLNIKL